ncbi:MAG: ankyrin repeat domain-containing protein [Acidobacteriota bacterium]|nr:ankyrin repeat domain-containing protein [Acidobacteriota bacterium]
MTRDRKVTSFLILLISGVSAALAQEPADRAYRAIRGGDIAALRAVLKTSDVNAKDKRGDTALMYSAAYGNLETMRILLAAGADVNAKNAFDATALMWCAGDIGKARLLIDRGADVNARSKLGRTPLLIAAAYDGGFEIVKLLLDKGARIAIRDNAVGTTPLLMASGANEAATVKLLLEKGADANEKDRAGNTALMNAAEFGNVATIKMLLARKADVNAVSAPHFGPGVKNGPIALGSFTPLILAAAYGGPVAVKILLDAGAKVDAQDVRGMTPLMLAIATDHPNVSVVRLLLENKADMKLKDLNGETALDWAAKFRLAPVMSALGQQSKAAEIIPAGFSVLDRKPADARAALEKSIALLQRTGGTFFKEGGCVSCHAQNLTAMAVSAARGSGLRVDENAEAEQRKSVQIGWASFEQPLLQRLDPPGGAEMVAYALFHMDADEIAPDRTTDALVNNLAGQQRSEGNWHFGGVARPPMEDFDFARTAMSIRALQRYGPPARKPEFDKRVERASGWLAGTEPGTNEDRVMQLLGLKWSGADRATIKSLQGKLTSEQRKDGGWAQRPELESDAYATGQALYALRESGVPASDPACRSAVGYLLRTQLDDGSWHVRSRAPKFQPYFQSGFPHDHDQWISSAATAWAAIGLAGSLGEKP